MLNSDFGRRCALVGYISCKKLIKHNAKGVDVDGRIRFLPLCLFWSQIMGTAHDCIVPGQLYGIVGDRNSEIRDFHSSIIFDQYILRFDVPMNDLMFMSMTDRAGQLFHDRHSLGHIKRPTLHDQLFECPPPHKFHHDIVKSFGFPHIINVNDIGMRQFACRIGLPLETDQSHGIFRKL